MISLMSDVQSKKPHFRCKGGVWSCTTYRHKRGAWCAEFRIGYGYTVMGAWNDWKQQEFA